MSKSDKEDSGDWATAYAHWLSDAHEQGLLVSKLTNYHLRAKADFQTADCGISLQYLHDFACLMETLQPADTSTAAVMSKVLIPYTCKAKKCRLFDAVPFAHTGKPSIYVLHAWGAPFMPMVQQLVATLGSGPLVSEPGAAAQDVSPAASLASTYVWLDIFAINQHPQLNSEVDISLVKDMAQACTQGAAVVVDRQMLVLTRTWCLYEMWSFIHHEGITKLKVCLPADMSIEDIGRFENKCAQLDVANSSSSKQKDKAHILSEIKGSVGVKSMQHQVYDAIQMLVHSTLRWSPKFADLALYCVALLQCGEFSRLQQTLHHIPGLADDERAVREVQDIFKTYSNADTGELDEDLFADALQANGFQEEEARAFFQQMPKTAGGGVTLDNFTEWWLHAKRQERLVSWKPPVMKVEELLENLCAFQAMLQRKGLQDLAKLIRQFIKEQQEGRLIKFGTRLAPTTFKSDWRSTSEEVSEMLHEQDFRGAAVSLYGFLRWNTDAFYHPPSRVPKGDTESMGLREVCQSLSQYLHLFSSMLWVLGGLQQYSDHYKNWALELESSKFVDAVVEQQGEFASPIRGRKTKSERQIIVRNMVALKYGEDTPAFQSLLAEAQISLSVLTSSAKAVAKASPHPAFSGDFDQMTSDYMSFRGHTDQARPAPVVKQKEKPNPWGISPEAEQPSALLSLGPEAVAYYKSLHQSDEADRGGCMAQHGRASSSPQLPASGDGTGAADRKSGTVRSLDSSSKGRKSLSAMQSKSSMRADAFVANAKRLGLISRGSAGSGTIEGPLPAASGQIAGAFDRACGNLTRLSTPVSGLFGGLQSPERPSTTASVCRNPSATNQAAECSGREERFYATRLTRHSCPAIGSHAAPLSPTRKDASSPLGWAAPAHNQPTVHVDSWEGTVSSGAADACMRPSTVPAQMSRPAPGGTRAGAPAGKLASAGGRPSTTAEHAARPSTVASTVAECIGRLQAESARPMTTNVLQGAPAGLGNVARFGGGFRGGAISRQHGVGDAARRQMPGSLSNGTPSARAKGADAGLQRTRWYTGKGCDADGNGSFRDTPNSRSLDFLPGHRQTGGEHHLIQAKPKLRVSPLSSPNALVPTLNRGSAPASVQLEVSSSFAYKAPTAAQWLEGSEVSR